MNSLKAHNCLFLRNSGKIEHIVRGDKREDKASLLKEVNEERSPLKNN